MAQLTKIPVRTLGMSGPLEAREPTSTPQQIADAGGWWGNSPYLTGTALAPWQEYRCYRETMAEANWRNVRGQSPLRHLMGGRFELITEYDNPWDSGDGLAPMPDGWQDWIATVPRAQSDADYALWKAAGWTFQAHSFAKLSFLYDPAIYNANVAPCHYWGLDWTNKLMGTVRLLAKIDHPGYLDWLVEQIVVAMRWYGADSIQLGWKQYYLVGTRVLRPDQTLEAADGTKVPGTDSAAWITRCPLTLEQVVSGVVGLTERLAARGISIVWAGMGTDDWMPNNEAVKAMWLGQAHQS